MIDLQDTEQLLEYISSAPKSTPSVFFLKLNRRLDFRRFRSGRLCCVRRFL